MQGSDVNTSSVTGLLKHADDTINQKKEKVDRIAWQIHLLNGIYVCFAIAGTCLALIDRRYFYVGTCCLLIFKNIVLVYSICRISKFIKTLTNAAPN